MPWQPLRKNEFSFQKAFAGESVLKGDDRQETPFVVAGRWTFMAVAKHGWLRLRRRRWRRWRCSGRIHLGLYFPAVTGKAANVLFFRVKLSVDFLRHGNHHPRGFLLRIFIARKVSLYVTVRTHNPQRSTVSPHQRN